MEYEVFVIIPVYNAERFIEKAAASVLGQQADRIRIVLIDDGSADMSGVLCDELARNHSGVKVIHQENRGVSCARNTGIEYVLSQCEGRNEDVYIAFLDADDFWYEGVDLAEVHPEHADLIAFSAASCNCEGTRFGGLVCQSDDIRYYDLPNTQWISSGHFCSWLYHVELIRNHRLRFQEGTRLGEDIIFWRQAIFCAHKIKFCKNILHIYRMNPKSVTHNMRLEDSLTLHIPHATAQALKWGEGLPDAWNIIWKKTCAEMIGARLLESMRIMAESGTAAEQIQQIVENSGLKPYLDALRTENLAKWQRNDFKMYHKGMHVFTRYHRMRGVLPGFKRAIAGRPLLRIIWEKLKFRMKHL